MSDGYSWQDLLQDFAALPWQPLRGLLSAYRHVGGASAALLLCETPPWVVSCDGPPLPPELPERLRQALRRGRDEIVAGGIAETSYVALHLDLPQGGHLGTLCLLFDVRRLPDSRLRELLRGMAVVLQAEMLIQARLR